jgi:hypothetical protein
MLGLPPDIDVAKLLARAMHHLTMPENPSYPVYGWLQEQLSMLDRDNRFTIDETEFKQRQGAAQAISQMLEYITNAKDEVLRLEGGTWSGRIPK